MNNKTYDILKWIAIIVVPAIATFVGTVGLAISWQYTDIAVLIITAVGTLLGSILGVSNNQYNKTGKE